MNVHNEKRAQHGVPDLRIDWKMQKKAQEYAELLNKLKKIQHSKPTERDGAGENLLVGNVNNATEIWYSEIQDYDYSKGLFS